MKSRFLLMLLVLSPLVVACSAQNEGTPPAAPAAIETPAAPVEPTVATPEAAETPEAPNATPTDADPIQISRAGVAAALVSLPLRYMHTPVEMISIRDLDHAIQLIARAVAGIKPGQNWIPF